MDKRIVYTRADGTTCYLTPVLSSGMTLEEIAAKDVPFGIHYRIIDKSVLDEIGIFSEAIEIDNTDADGIGADYGVGSTNAVVAYGANRSAITRKIKTKVINGDEIEFVDFSSKPIKHSSIPSITPNDTINVNINIPKARDMHMNNIRIARDKKLLELDIEQMKGNDVSAQKQVLRDLPTTFDLSVASTPDELKALWPEEVSKT